MSPIEHENVNQRVRENRVVELRAIEDLKVGDLVQHYSTWEQTYGDPLRREVVAIRYGPRPLEHEHVVTWRDPNDPDAEPYETREKSSKRVDLVVGEIPPMLEDEELAERRARIDVHCGGCGATFPGDTKLHNGMCRECCRADYHLLRKVERYKKALEKIAYLAARLTAQEDIINAGGIARDALGADDA